MFLLLQFRSANAANDPNVILYEELLKKSQKQIATDRHSQLIRVERFESMSADRFCLLGII